MKIYSAYKTELDPNNVQRALLMKHAGTARFAYNWGLRRKQEVYEMNQLPVPHIKSPTAIDLHRELNKMKKSEFPWMYDVSKCAPQEALRDLAEAFEYFFMGLARYPKFKSKRKGLGAFRLSYDIKVSDNTIQLPRLGKIRLKERGYPKKDLHILSATVSENAGRWFVSVRVEREIEPPTNKGPITGVDLGSTELATVSDGKKYLNPKALKCRQRRLKKLQREVSRRKKGSNNRRKSVRKLSKTHMKVANIRRDAVHKATTELARTKSVIVVEGMNVVQMLKNHNLAGAISDAGWGEFRRQLSYKTVWYGSKMLKADRYFPSSKMCSVCGHVKKHLSLSEHVYECENCGSKIDRHLNAAINLKRLAVSSTESVNACLRREVSGPTGPVPVDDSGTERHKEHILLDKLRGTVVVPPNCP